MYFIIFLVQQFKFLNNKLVEGIMVSLEEVSKEIKMTGMPDRRRSPDHLLQKLEEYRGGGNKSGKHQEAAALLLAGGTGFLWQLQAGGVVRLERLQQLDQDSASGHRQ